MRDTDTVARMDDDFNFGIIAFGADGEVDIDILKLRLAQALETPIQAGAETITLEKGLNFDIFRLDEEHIVKAVEIFGEDD